jgi:hypothetical protein
MCKNTGQQPSQLHSNRHLQNGDVVSCVVSDDHDCAYVTRQLGLDDDVLVAAYDVAQALYFSVEASVSRVNESAIEYFLISFDSKFLPFREVHVTFNSPRWIYMRS